MSTNLPMVPLGEVLNPVCRAEKVTVGTSYRVLGVRWYANGLFIKDILDGGLIRADKVFRVKTGDFVYNRLFAWKGSFAIADESVNDCVVSNEFPCFSADTARLDLRYLLHYMSRETAWGEALGMSTGGTPTSRNRLKEESLLRMAIPLPPIGEQRRIVSRIEALAAKIAEARGLRELASVQGDLLRYKIMESMRHKVLADKYEVKLLGNVTRVTAGGTPARDNPSFWGGDIPWIKTGELKDTCIESAEEYITEEAVQESSAKLFPVDTVLIALYGQGQTRGRTGRLAIPATTNQACAAILPTPALEPRFLQYWLMSMYTEMREDSHGGAQPNWNGKMIKDIAVALPPLADQHRLVVELDGALSQISRLTQLQAATAAELTALLPSVLDKAFKGEL